MTTLLVTQANEFTDFKHQTQATTTAQEQCIQQLQTLLDEANEKHEAATQTNAHLSTSLEVAVTGRISAELAQETLSNEKARLLQQVQRLTAENTALKLQAQKAQTTDTKSKRAHSELETQLQKLKEALAKKDEALQHLRKETAALSRQLEKLKTQFSQSTEQHKQALKKQAEKFSAKQQEAQLTQQAWEEDFALLKFKIQAEKKGAAFILYLENPSPLYQEKIWEHFFVNAPFLSWTPEDLEAVTRLYSKAQQNLAITAMLQSLEVIHDKQKNNPKILWERLPPERLVHLISSLYIMLQREPIDTRLQCLTNLIKNLSTLNLIHKTTFTTLPTIESELSKWLALLSQKHTRLLPSHLKSPPDAPPLEIEQRIQYALNHQGAHLSIPLTAHILTDALFRVSSNPYLLVTPYTIKQYYAQLFAQDSEELEATATAS